MMDLTTDAVLRQSDIVIILGGDGTLLNIAKQNSAHNTPLLGVNLGRVGVFN